MYYPKLECDSCIDVSEKMRWDEESVKPLVTNTGEHIQCICASRVRLKLPLAFYSF